MSVNKFRPHVFVLSEDDANREIANGFLLEPSLNERAIQVLPPSGGWTNVLNDFKNNQVGEMSKYLSRYIILLIDFDQREDRLTKVRTVIPDYLADRVFVLGVLSVPEDLRKAGLGNLEAIGKDLARECRESTDITWRHELLRHNAEELRRMTPILKPILFP